MRRIFRHPEDALGGDLEIVGRGRHDIGNESLWISVVEREPTTKHLHKKFVSLQENVIGGVKTVFKFAYFIWLESAWLFKTFAVIKSTEKISSAIIN